MNLRLLALGGAVVCAVALPLAMASAGSVGDGGGPAVRLPAVTDRGAVTDSRTGTESRTDSDGRTGTGGGTDGGRSTDGAPSTDGGRGTDADGDHRADGDVRDADGDRGIVAEDRTGAEGGRRTEADSRADAKAVPAGPSRSPLLLGPGLATAARCGPELSSPDGVEAQTCVLVQGEDTWARTYYRNATGRFLDAVLSFMEPQGRTVRMRCAVGADDEPGTCETPRERLRGRPTEYTAVAEFAAAGGAGPLLLRSGSNSSSDASSHSFGNMAGRTGS
ncbi:hypothetical protein [Streptomyces sp. NPDC088812]|uniref:hypothetical protein n=1 Tax=Streptomyces sp. NPDC088812 TaxID=3365905 RepID=UPI003827429F